jgi:hypothetical protein
MSRAASAASRIPPILRVATVALLIGLGACRADTAPGAANTPVSSLPAPSRAPTGAYERRFLQAASLTGEFRVLSLDADPMEFVAVPPRVERPDDVFPGGVAPPPPPPPPVPKPADCKRVACVGKLEVLGETRVPQAESAGLRVVLRGWLEGGPLQVSACMPAYHHAIAFSHDGHEYVALLCYSCGQYELWIDGKAESGGDVPGAKGLDTLNALLATAGVRGFVPPMEPGKSGD